MSEFFQPDHAGSASGQVRGRGDDAQLKARELDIDIGALRQRVDRLEMVVEALWETVKARTGATEADMLELIEKVDLRDGKLNGRTAPTVLNCSACHRPVSATTGVCLYCGAQNFRATVF